MITLTSDFGTRDPYAGIMRSRIVQRAPQLPIIDLTHEISAFAVEQAGYWLYCCHPQFPAGTIHVAVVDPGVGSARAILVLEAAGQLFIAPDNGLLGLLAQSLPYRAYRVTDEALSRLHIAPSSATFHGRDIMAPLAAELGCQRIRADEVGPAHTPAPGRLACAQAMPDRSIRGTVALIDHYGNALTTIPGAALKSLRAPQVRFEQQSLRILRTYADAGPGECFALVNSASMLELATRQGSAAQALNIQPGRTMYLVETVAES